MKQLSDPSGSHLTLAKAIADLGGISLIEHPYQNGFWTWDYDSMGCKETISLYDPFDWSILGPLIVKYKHILDLEDCFCGVKDEDIARTILECILEANA